MCSGVPGPFADIILLLNELQQIGVAVAAAVAGIMLVYSGYLWMVSIDGKETARQLIVRVIIGMTIVLMASGIVDWIEGLLC